MKNIDKEIERIEKGKAWEDSDEVVKLQVKKTLDKVVPIRLQAVHWEELRQIAGKLGVGPTTLARMWILERLRSEAFRYENIQQSAVLNMVREENQISLLTPRELEILRLVSQGLNNKEIAELSHIGENQIKLHLIEISRKLNLRQRYTTIHESAKQH